MTRRNLAICSLLCLFFLCVGDRAQAQEDSLALLTTTTTMGSVLVTGGGLTTTMVLTSQDMNDYLRQNEVAIAHDLALGAGPTIDDLAAKISLQDDKKARFGIILRQHRETLIALADPSVLTDERAEVFFETIVKAAEGVECGQSSG